MTVGIRADFLADLAHFYEQVPELASEAAAGALNTVATRSGLTMIRNDINAEVNFPSGYLDDPSRLGVTQRATPQRLEVIIAGRDDPTSLARFAPGQSYDNSRKQRIVVQVKRGGTGKALKAAFMVKLKNGNTGLAVRLKPGDSLIGSTKAKQLDGNVYLLYGPSVDQVLGTLASKEIESLGDMVSKEFLRQFTWKGFS